MQVLSQQQQQALLERNSLFMTSTQSSVPQNTDGRFSSELAQCAALLDTLKRAVDSGVPASANENITLLELMLTKAYKLAVQPRDDGQGPEDRARIADLASSVLDAFQAFKSGADTGINDYEMASNQISGFESQRLMPLAQQFSQANGDTENKMARFAEERSTLQLRAKSLNQQGQSLDNELRQVQEKMRSMDVNVDTLFLLGGGMFGGMMGELQNARQLHATIRRRIKETQHEAMQTQHCLMELSQGVAQLEVGKSMVARNMAELKMLRSMHSALARPSDYVVKQLRVLQQAATKLLEKAATIRGNAIAKAGDKDELVAQLLDLCAMTLVGVRLTDEVGLVSRELEVGYGSNAVPPAVNERLTRVREKLQALVTAKTS